MKYFTVLYSMPVEGLEAWMETPEEERKAAEKDLQTQWNTWMEAHADALKNTISLGTNTRVTSAGSSVEKNGLMLSSYVEAESVEAAAALFSDHPHLQIPGAVIDIMEAKQLGAM